MLEAVLFDWGDTLVGYEWNDDVALAGNRAGLAALDRLDLPDAEAIVAYFSERGAELFPDGEDEADFDEIMRGCFLQLGAELTDEELARYMDASHAVWEDIYTVPTTTHALLDALRARGLKLAIVSNTATPARFILRLLEQQGLAERVDAVVLSCEVGKRKPYAAIFERALAELGVEPERALFVGDRRYHDVRGAAQVGMRTVQALWFRADEHEQGAEPDFQAFTQMDVLNVVRRLNGER